MFPEVFFLVLKEFSYQLDIQELISNRIRRSEILTEQLNFLTRSKVFTGNSDEEGNINFMNEGCL